MATCTSTWTWNKYVDVNISKPDDNGSYKDTCGNVISVQKLEDKPNKGYKIYIHSFSSGYYVGSIKYNSHNQLGVGNIKGQYYTGVYVVYFRYDYGNEFPILIGVKKDKNIEYYSRTTYYFGNSWKAAGITEQTLSQKFQTITAQMKQIGILSLGVIDGNYCSNGETSGSGIIITVSCTSFNSIYKKCSHTFPYNSMIILSTKNNSDNIPINTDNKHATYVGASVYYWNGDSGHERPLVLQLAYKSSLTYYTFANASWKKNVTESKNLNNLLDKENCDRNRAHQIDISKTTGTTYPCLTSGCKVQISLSGGIVSGYSRFSHDISGDSSNLSVSRFKDGNDEQIGLPSIKGIRYVVVFLYPKEGGTPLLIDYQGSNSHRWFKRRSPTVNTWTEIVENTQNRPEHDGDHENILKNLLDSYSPPVAIDISQAGGIYNPTTSLSFNVDQTTVNGSKFVKCKHHRNNNEPFKITGFTHNSSTLNGIPTSYVLCSVSVFYYSGDTKHEKPLLVELEISDATKTKHKYWKKPSGKNGDWTELTRSDGETTRLESEDLKEILDKLKEGHFPNTLNPSPVAPSQASEAKDNVSVLEESTTSVVGPLVGGIIGTLVALVAMVLLVKFWPKVRTRFVGIRNGFGIHKKEELNM